MILDTCFLIDLQREFRSKQPGPASAFLKTNSQTRFHISVISVAEFLEGFPDPSQGERLIRSYERIHIDSKVAAQTAIFRRRLRNEGRPVGDFDILIAATAVVETLPLVTCDIEHFQRFKELDLIPYR